MSMFIYELSPTFTLGLLALSFLFRVPQRSVSTFIIILTSSLVVNLNHNGHQEYSSLLILIALIFLLVRAMMKPANDKWICRPYHGKERRKRRKI